MVTRPQRYRNTLGFDLIRYVIPRNGTRRMTREGGEFMDVMFGGR